MASCFFGDLSLIRDGVRVYVKLGPVLHFPLIAVHIGHLLSLHEAAENVHQLQVDNGCMAIVPRVERVQCKASSGRFG
jgi:hypothetical protein